MMISLNISSCLISLFIFFVYFIFFDLAKNKYSEPPRKYTLCWRVSQCQSVSQLHTQEPRCLTSNCTTWTTPSGELTSLDCVSSWPKWEIFQIKSKNVEMLIYLSDTIRWCRGTTGGAPLPDRGWQSSAGPAAHPGGRGEGFLSVRSDCQVSVVHSHWSRNVQARLSLVESFPSDAGASSLMP